MQEYIEQYKILHLIKKKYGKSSEKLLDIIEPILVENKITSLLDFGCGKSSLANKISELYGIDCYKYDPAIEKYSTLVNEKIDFVICTDVLQHVPYYDLENVMSTIRSLSDFALLKIKCTTHHTLLPNGQPANCTVHDEKWWMNFIYNYYNCIEKIDFEDTTSVILLVRSDNNV